LPDEKKLLLTNIQENLYNCRQSNKLVKNQQMK